MKARAAIWKTLVDECLDKGMSLRATAAFLALPVGTVKTWRHRQRKQADKSVRVSMKPAMKPAPAKERATAMKPGMKPGVHRGLTVEMMPGRTGWERRMTWSLFRRGEWPPKEWRIPADLEGPALASALGERAFKSKPRGEA
jgi:hypothetical protein